MLKSYPRWLMIGLLALAWAAASPTSANAQWGAGWYHRWYGWAGPLYGGFGGYPGARYVSGAGGWGGGWGGGMGGAWGGGWDMQPGCYDCDCWSGMGVGENATPSPTKAMMQPATPAVPGNSVIMNLRVPPEARVYINGKATTAKGSERNFRLDNLAEGKYPYEVRVELQRDGQKLVESKTVQLETGKRTYASFNFRHSDRKTDALVTSLTLRVPDGAKVFLGDNPTHATGSVRRFSTTLKPGEQMRDYKVRVEAQVDGKLQVQQQMISLAAGDTRELKFDFKTSGEPLVAAGER